MYSLGLNKNFIFVHIPKTGGGSIKNHLIHTTKRENLFYPKDGTINSKAGQLYHARLEHYKSRQFVDRFVVDNIDEFYKFTSIRNPWERMVSLYHFRKGGTDTAADVENKSSDVIEKRIIDDKWPIGKNPTLKNDISFIDWAKNYQENINATELTQYLDFFDARAMSKIVRLESLDEDFNDVCDELGIRKKPLLKIHASQHEHYSEYYNNATKDIVYKLFEKDIDYFRYEF